MPRELAPVSLEAPLAAIGLAPWEVAQASRAESETPPVEAPLAQPSPSTVIVLAVASALAEPAALGEAPVPVAATVAQFVAEPAAKAEAETTPPIDEPAASSEPPTNITATAAPAADEPEAKTEIEPPIDEPAASSEPPTNITATAALAADEPEAKTEIETAQPVAEPATGVEPSDETAISPASLLAGEPLAVEPPTAALEAAPPTRDEAPQASAEGAELDSNSDNEPTHVVDATILRSRLSYADSELDDPKLDDSKTASASEGAELESESPPVSEEHVTLPLAVEQALALEHAQDAAQTLDPDLPEPVKAERDFSSMGSETPVVLSTPAPPRVEGPLTARSDAARPEAKPWSKKLRATPRTLVIGAPLVALFGIWTAHQLAARSPHDTSTPSAATETPAAVDIPAANPPAVAPDVVAPSAPPASVETAVSVESAQPAALAPPSADPAELKAAQIHGLPALESLAEKYPTDVQVGIALASQQARAQRFEAAVDTLDHLLAISPSSVQNGKVMGILWRAAQSSASERTFASLRKLGAHGSDIAFDLAVTPGVREAVRESASAELAEHLAEGASADTRVAAALLLAPDCGARQALLERAEREGGKRTRGLLERYSRGSGCTSSADRACSACLVGNPVLARVLVKLGEGVEP